jgi:hypothetical protein
MNQAQKINRIFRLCMVVLYLVAAVAIWWLPVFDQSKTELKIALSVVLVLYAIFRFFRTVRQRPNTEDEL